MPIIENREALLPFTQAVKLLPHRRANRAPALATLYRWSNNGLKGVKLEFVQLGGTRCTSEEALYRFIQEVTARTTPPSVSSEIRTPCQREAAIRAAEAELARDGI